MATGMDKEKTIKLLELFPEIDGEISVRRNIVSDLEQYHVSTGGDVPDYVKKEIKMYEEQIRELQLVKVEILKEVSRLNLKQKKIIFGFYFHSMKWGKVAIKTNYSERQCKNIRDEAVGKLLKGFKKNQTLIEYEIKE